jgi:hypothetical protein
MGMDINWHGMIRNLRMARPLSCCNSVRLFRPFELCRKLAELPFQFGDL